MAEKGLADVTEGLKAVQGAIENPPKSAADKEAATEKARSDAANKSIFQGIYDTLQKGFGAATGKDKKQGGLIAGLLGGVGAGLGGIGKAVGSLGMGFAKGMIGLGAGIGGFAIALGGAAMILSLMGTDGSALTSIITNFFDAFTESNAAKMGVIVVIAGLLAGFNVKGTDMAFMMTGIGAGIAGFAGGILLGSALAGYGLTLMGGLDGGALAKLLNSFFGAITPETAAGMGVVVTLAGVANRLGIKGIKGASSLAFGMTGIGAGIAGFAGGILLGSAATEFGLEALGGIDTTSLTNLLGGFFGAMTPAIAVGLGTIVGLAGIAVRLGIKGIKGALDIGFGMTGIGAGIAGFSIGILLADGAAKLGEMANLDGSSLKTLISNFMGAFDGIGIVALGALIIAGAAVGIVPGGVVAVVAGMTAIGAGIAGFMVPLLAADWIAGLGGDNAGGNLAVLLTNIGKGLGGFLGAFAGETFEQMKMIDGDKLAQIGKGILNLGLGMVAFAGGRAAGGIADIAGGIGNAISGLFGGEKKGPLHIFAEISKDTSIDANRLTALGSGISDLALGLGAFADVSTTGLLGNTLALSEFSLPDSDTLAKFMNIGSTEGTKTTTSHKKYVNGKLVEDDIDGKSQLATGGLVTPRTAGIFQLHQGEMVLDNAAVAAFSKSLDLMNKSQENAMAERGGGTPIIVNNNNVDNSMQSSQTTAVSIPEPTRTNESTVRALQMTN